MEETILLNEYTGRLEEILSQEKMAEIYEGKLKPRDLNMIQNQYLYMLDNEDCSLIDKLRVDGDNFVPLKYLGKSIGNKVFNFLYIFISFSLKQAKIPF